MGARAYKKDSHVRKLVEGGVFERRGVAETSVEVQYEVVEEVTENLASEEFVEAEFKAQREYIDGELAVLKSDVAVLESDMAVLKSDMAEVKSELKEMRSDMVGIKVEVAKQGTRFMLVAIAVVALMQGLNLLNQ